MKKITQAIQILQIIAFFVLIKVDFSPITLFFLRSINVFATFKLVPDEVMSDGLIYLGLKEKEEILSN